jgi:hypothetical protein
MRERKVRYSRWDAGRYTYLRPLGVVGIDAFPPRSSARSVHEPRCRHVRARAKSLLLQLLGGDPGTPSTEVPGK